MDEGNSLDEVREKGENSESAIIMDDNMGQNINLIDAHPPVCSESVSSDATVSANTSRPHTISRDIMVPERCAKLLKVGSTDALIQ